MKEWKTYKLSEIAEIQTGPFGSQLHNNDYVDNGTPIVTVEHLGNRKFSTQNLPCVSDADKARLSKYILHEGDIVFSRVGSVDRCSYVSSDEDGWMFSGRCLRVRCNNMCNPLFLYYYFCKETIKQYIRSIAVGATMPSINTKLLSDLPITLPSIDVQDKAVQILSRLDDKIELNRQINDNLEQQAQALYKSWFVDFEPFKGGEFIESEIGEIPTGWSIVKFGDIVEIPKKTINPQKFPDTIFNHYSLPACDNGLIAEVQAGKDIMSNKIILQSNTTLFSKLNPRIKRIWFTCEVLPNSICSTEFIPYRAKIDTEYSYIFSIVNSDAFYSSVMGCVNGATGSHQRFHAEDTEDFLCAYNKDAVNKFSKLIEPVLKQMHDLRQENVKLALTRDTLLPKLMSGELKINEIDC